MPKMASCLLLYKLSCDVCQQLVAVWSAQSAVYFIYRKIGQIGWHTLLELQQTLQIARPGVWPWRGLKPRLQPLMKTSPTQFHGLAFWYKINFFLLLLRELPNTDNWTSHSLIGHYYIVEIGTGNFIWCTLTISVCGVHTCVWVRDQLYHCGTTDSRVRSRTHYCIYDGTQGL